MDKYYNLLIRKIFMLWASPVKQVFLTVNKMNNFRIDWHLDTYPETVHRFCTRCPQGAPQSKGFNL